MSRLSSPSFSLWQGLSHSVWAGNPSPKPGCQTIYVDLFHDSFDYLAYSLTIGRLIGIETGLPVVGLTGRLGAVHGSCHQFDLDEITAIAHGYDVPVVMLDEGAATGSAISLIAQEALRQGLELPELSGAALRRFVKAVVDQQGFALGRYVYDTHLRNTRTETISEFDVALLESFERCLVGARVLDARFDHSAPAWFVTGHVDYAPWGMASEKVLARGGRLAYFRNEGNLRIHLAEGAVAPGKTVCGHIRQTGGPSEKALVARIADEAPDLAEAHFQAISSGARFCSHRFLPTPMPDLASATHGPIIRAMRAAIGFNANRPLVGLFSITFSDIPVADEQAFEDNYAWLSETLAFGALHPDIDWVVKIHPADKNYNVTGAMQRLQERFGEFPNIRFVGTEWSPTALIAACDVVTSLRGSPGMQAALAGRPAVFCGHGQYSDMGFGQIGLTPERYFELLVENARNPVVPAGETLRARAFRFVEDVVFSNPSSLLGSFGELACSIDPWSDLARNLRWYSQETDPLRKAIGVAIRENRTRVASGDPFLSDCRIAPRASAELTQGSFAIRHFWPEGVVPLFGFHEVEPWGVWMAGRGAALLVKVGEPLEGVLRLRIACKGLIPPDWPMPEMAVTVGGMSGFPVDDGSQSPDELVFDVGPGVFGVGGSLLFEFSLSPGTVPDASRGDGDQRVLTFSLRDVAWNLRGQTPLPAGSADAA